MAAEVTYANMIKQSQTNIWELINTNSTIAAFSPKVLNNAPRGLTKPVGFPWVLIPLPKLESERLTMSLKTFYLTFEVEVWTKRYDETIGLMDAIRDVLSQAEDTFSFSDIMHQFLDSGQPNYVDLRDDGGSIQKCQQYKIIVQYIWIGEPS